MKQKDRKSFVKKESECSWVEWFFYLLIGLIILFPPLFLAGYAFAKTREPALTLSEYIECLKFFWMGFWNEPKTQFILSAVIIGLCLIIPFCMIAGGVMEDRKPVSIDSTAVSSTPTTKSAIFTPTFLPESFVKDAPAGFSIQLYVGTYETIFLQATKNFPGPDNQLEPRYVPTYLAVERGNVVELVLVVKQRVITQRNAGERFFCITKSDLTLDSFYDSELKTLQTWLSVHTGGKQVNLLS